MKLRVDLIFAAVLVASAGLELATPEAQSAVPTDQACQIEHKPEGTTRIEAEERILAEGYSEISSLAKGCDNAWHAIAFAEGDPVRVLVTAAGTVLTE
jgi:hypothetical protein